MGPREGPAGAALAPRKLEDPMARPSPVVSRHDEGRPSGVVCRGAALCLSSFV